MTLFDDRSVCPVCSTRLGSREVVAFPPFVANRREPSYLFSGAACHRSCVESHALGELAIRMCEEFLRHSRVGGARCRACHEEITEPSDSFRVAFMTSEEASPIFAYNFLAIHRTHFLCWEGAVQFRERMQAFLSSGAWSGEQLIFDPLPSWRWTDTDSARARGRVVAASPQKRK
jgi:hypothetical protein